MTRPLRAALAAILALGLAGPAFGWGSTGHELVSGAAIDALSRDVPAFLKTKEARAQIALLGREPDRSKNAGKTHDFDRDPAHYIDLGDDGTVGGLDMSALPVSRVDFEVAMRAAGFKPGSPGYLPYAMIDGYQQVVKDFGYWRASRIGAKTAKTKADRDWFAADMKLRETLILRDIGVWSHFVGDGSQPQHLSEHHAGWDAYPDPMTYPPPGQPPEIKTIHNYFEGPFVKANVTLAAVRQAMAPYHDCACTIEQRVPAYIKTSLAQLKPLYDLVTAGDFKATSPKAVAYATARVAAGATEVRDQIEDAWKASAKATVGWPNINVSDIESGKVILSRNSYGSD